MKPTKKEDLDAQFNSVPTLKDVNYTVHPSMEEVADPAMLDAWFDFSQAGLKSGSGPSGGGAVSLTMEFPPLSSPIHDAAPYGRQILMLAGA